VLEPGKGRRQSIGDRLPIRWPVDPEEQHIALLVQSRSASAAARRRRASRQSGLRRSSFAPSVGVGVIEVAKHAGFSLDEVGALLGSIDEGAPAHEQLQALAVRKLPEIDALIDRARKMRDWLAVASVCGCESLDDCGLFEEEGQLHGK
jgi:DNA-binding transcriptional MerR regulator